LVGSALQWIKSFVSILGILACRFLLRVSGFLSVLPNIWFGSIMALRIANRSAVAASAIAATGATETTTIVEATTQSFSSATIFLLVVYVVLVLAGLFNARISDWVEKLFHVDWVGYLLPVPDSPFSSWANLEKVVFFTPLYLALGCHVLWYFWLSSIFCLHETYTLFIFNAAMLAVQLRMWQIYYRDPPPETEMLSKFKCTDQVFKDEYKLEVCVNYCY